MTKNNIKAILFAGLIAAMILPFSMMDVSAVPNENANEKAHVKDKTKQIKEHRQTLDAKVQKFKEYMEKKIELQEKIEQKKSLNQSANDLQNELDLIESEWTKTAKKHKEENTIPPGQLKKLMKQQEEIESILFANPISNYVTSIGIDLGTKEIQIGLNTERIGDDKVGIINSVDNLIPKHIPWHSVDSTPAKLDSCIDQEYCDPIMGGNEIDTAISSVFGECSLGFKVSSGSLIGFVTAGHCVDNKVGTDVDDNQGDKVGSVLDEEFYWGTSCDCAFVWDSTNSEIDNKTYLSQGTQVTVTSYTSASNQNGDFIYKSGSTDPGVTYGVVTGINKTVWEPFHNPPLYIKSLVQSNAVHVGGDSGGAVMSGSSIYGVISSHDSNGYYHVPTDKIMFELDVDPVLG